MMPGSTEYRAWLKTLKVGDTVALYRDVHPRKAVIKSETPTRFVIENTQYRKEDGHSHGGISDGFVHPYTAEVKEQIFKRRLTAAIDHAMPHALWHLDGDQLREIALIVGTVHKECAEVADEALKS